MASEAPSYCIQHLKWTPCLGRHQRRDSGESCYYSTDTSGIDIIRKVHAGMISFDDGKNLLDSVNAKKIEWALDVSDY